MKAKTFKLFLFLAGIILLMTIGCKKEIKRDPMQHVQQLNPTDLKFSQMIENFRSACLSPLKDDKTMCLDSILWYLKATTNYTYGNASDSNQNLSIDSVFLAIPKNGGTLPIAQVSILYDSVIENVRRQYYNINGVHRNLLFVDVCTNTGATSLKVTSAITYGGIYDPYVFYSWDNWYWAFLQGKCSPSSGGQGQDASTQITQKFMIKHAQPLPPNYWIPFAGIHEIAVDFPVGSSPTNYEGYYLFHNDDRLSGFHECIPWGEMNFYLSGVEHIAYHAMYDLYPNLVGYDNMSVELHAVNNQNHVIEHDGYFYYGAIHASSQPPWSL